MGTECVVAHANPMQFSKIDIPVRIGHSVTHPTHRLSSYKGVFFCTVCGNMAKDKISKLALPCTRIKKAHGRAVLAALHLGRFPPGVNNWPSDTISFPISTEPLSISELEILHEVQAKVNELAVAETLEVPSSPVSVGSNRTDTETVDLFWSDASVSGSD